MEGLRNPDARRPLTSSRRSWSRSRLSPAQSLDEPIQVFLPFEERLHWNAFIPPVGAEIIDIVGQA